MIKTLKILDKIYTNVELTVNQPTEVEVDVKVLDTGENGKEFYTTKKQMVTEFKEVANPLVPTDLDEFKKVAIDTINWQIGANVKKALGNTQTNLSASNAKGITLVAKILNGFNPALDGLTDLEKDSWNKMVALADGGYSDSELLNNSLTKVNEFIAAGTDRAARVASANSIEDVIAILNEE